MIATAVADGCARLPVQILACVTTRSAARRDGREQPIAIADVTVNITSVARGGEDHISAANYNVQPAIVSLMLRTITR